MFLWCVNVRLSEHGGMFCLQNTYVHEQMMEAQYITIETWGHPNFRQNQMR